MITAPVMKELKAFIEDSKTIFLESESPTLIKLLTRTCGGVQF